MGYCLYMGCKDYYRAQAVEMGTVWTWAGDMRYRLEVGCRDRVLMGHRLQILSTVWIQAVRMGVDWTLVVEMQIQSRDGHYLNKGNKEELQTRHGMWRWGTDWMCAVEKQVVEMG